MLSRGAVGCALCLLPRPPQHPPTAVHAIDPTAVGSPAQRKLEQYDKSSLLLYDLGALVTLLFW